MPDIVKVFLLHLMDPIILIPIIMTSIVSASVIATIVVGLLSAYLSAQFLTSEASTAQTYFAYLACGVILALICSFAATKVRKQLRRSNGRITFMRWQLALDNRVSIVVLALLLAYLIAAIAAHVLSSILNKESGEIWANVYASWVVDVTFFTLVGLAVSLMGFRSPTEESFTERISMLYGGKREPQVVMQYIAGQIRKLAAYGERASRELIINEYNQGLKAYRVLVRTRYTLRNMLDDVPYEDEIALSVSTDKFPVTPPSPIGRILSIWFKGEKLTQAAGITDQGFSTQIPIRLEPGETSEFKFEYELWTPVGEENWLMPQRATEVFEMALVSRCDAVNPLVALADKPGQLTTLVFNQQVKLDAVQGVSPGEKTFRFKFEEPAAIQQTTP